MQDYNLLTTVFSRSASVACPICSKPLQTGIALVLIIQDKTILNCAGIEVECCNKLMQVPKLFTTAHEADAFILSKNTGSIEYLAAPTRHDLDVFLRTIGKSIGELQFRLSNDTL